MPRMAYLVDALKQFEATAKAAETAGSFGPAVHAKAQALRVRAEIDQLRETERRQAMPSDADGHKAEILGEVRRLRQGATEAGSYIAAAGLLKLERELLTADEADRQAADSARLGSATEEDLRAEADAIRADLDAAEGPGGLRVVK